MSSVTTGNYIVTTSCKFPGALDSMSVLVYNIDENMAKTLRRIGSQEELLHVFRRYDRDGEFLIRSNGLEGEFRILRWRLDTENVIRRMEEMQKYLDKVTRKLDFFSEKLREYESRQADAPGEPTAGAVK